MRYWKRVIHIFTPKSYKIWFYMQKWGTFKRYKMLQQLLIKWVSAPRCLTGHIYLIKKVNIFFFWIFTQLEYGNN